MVNNIYFYAASFKSDCHKPVPALMPSFNVRQFPVQKPGSGSRSQPGPGPGPSTQIRKFRAGQWQIGNWYPVSAPRSPATTDQSRLRTGWRQPNLEGGTQTMCKSFEQNADIISAHGYCDCARARGFYYCLPASASASATAITIRRTRTLKNS